MPRASGPTRRAAHRGWCADFNLWEGCTAGGLKGEQGGGGKEMMNGKMRRVVGLGVDLERPPTKEWTA
jgi:hypothetical protein